MARIDSKLSALLPVAVAPHLRAERNVVPANAPLIEIDKDGTIKAMNSGAARLLRCRAQEYIGEPVAKVLPALNRGLDILETANRNGIALRTDGKVIHVKTTGVSYQSELSSGWKILIQRS